MHEDSLKSAPQGPLFLLICAGPLLLLALLLFLAIRHFGSDTTGGPAQVALILSGFFAALIAARRGIKWKMIERGYVDLVAQTSPALYIILMVGALIGLWMTVGIIPTIIYYGLYLVSPALFYVTVLVICAIVSLTIGSSWTAAGTIGLAFVAIATASGLSPAMTAGAVISGIYFGDKISPLSDTTNLAAASVNVNLFEHIRNLLITTVPAFLIALVFFLVAGLTGKTDVDVNNITLIREKIAEFYKVSPISLLPLILMFSLAVRKFEPLPTLAMGILTGLMVAVLMQPAIAVQTIFESWSALGIGHQSQTDMESLDQLLSRGGMVSMLQTIWLILAALFFGGAMEKSGCLHALFSPIVRGAKTEGSLVRRTGLTAVLSNIVTPDQYLSIVIPGRIYTPSFRERAFEERSLSRALEDYGTVTSPLVPWNTCGAYMAATLGVSTLCYAPFAVFCIATPIIATMLTFITRKAL